MSVFTRAQASEERSSLPPEQPQSPTKQRQTTLEKALSVLCSLDTTTSLRGNVRFSLTVENLVQVAMTDGLYPDQITTLLTVIGSRNPKLSQNVRSKLVKCLIPSHKVPQTAIVKIIYMITANAVSGPTNLHSLLLRWVLLVFDHLDGYEKLHRLYGLIFMFIDSMRLLPHACQLLFLLTRKEDVRLFRVQKLLDLVRMQGPEPCIMGLLMVYKVYCPHLVTIRLTYGTKAFFKNQDVVWRETIQTVISQGRRDEGQEEIGADVKRAVKRRQTAQRRMVKRQKLVTPDVHAAMQELEEEADVSENFHPVQPRVPYVQIDTFTSFLENIDNIEYPSQVSAVLQDSQLQLLMMCDPDPVVMARLSLWIQHVFAFGFKKTDEESQQNEDLLKMLLKFSQHVQDLPVLEAFLFNYLPTWDGQKYASVIFCLISCLGPNSLKFKETNSEILHSMLRLFYSSDVYFKASLVSSLTNLLHNWATKFLKLEKLTSTAVADLSTSSKGEGQTSNVSERSEREYEMEDLKQQVMYLIKCLDTTLVLGLRMEGDHQLLQQVAKQFMETVSVLFTKYSLPVNSFPTNVFYRLLLSDCPATLAAVCGSINQFRTSITALRESAHHSAFQAHQYTLCDTVASFPSMGTGLSEDAAARVEGASRKLGLDVFNSVLLDLMGMLWQGRMFTQRKRLLSAMTTDFTLPKHIEPNLYQRALTIFQGPAFLGLAYKFLTEAQGTEKKSHPSQIEKFKETYLQFLDREGFPQFRELVDTNIKSRKTASVDADESVRE
ncbi:hypothetical protein RRG08_030384 [Elysia crispata]|uniref:Centromere protein I n=1 Tax=Elysia crispata TaxID=231223 RepID=A0AAE0YG14_9GAST|nr:hypothetical protein RRG08_030384 [Elysia crispata]